VTRSEMLRVQKYLQDKFRTPSLEVRAGDGKDAPAEMYVGGEFLGVIYRDEDDGEVTYDLNMSILEGDLPVVAPV
jgi:hypothetical protein